MKIRLRRIGNSVGVILPKSTLDAWGVGEGDALDLDGEGLRPPGRSALSHRQLDELRRLLSVAVVRRCTPCEIRARILANLGRWKRQGVWNSAYDEWRAIAGVEDDGQLFIAMLGRDENSVRLRQSMPYVGLLPETEVNALYEEAVAWG
jgi:antitoxin component of MazEF toxin-antitoxin module